MSRRATSFVLGYHGCERDTGIKAVNGDLELLRRAGDSIVDLDDVLTGGFQV
ncbi:MAG TPA: hypothetical protein VII63_13345 [Caulobacteraceae bacterium]